MRSANPLGVPTTLKSHPFDCPDNIKSISTPFVSFAGTRVFSSKGESSIRIEFVLQDQRNTRRARIQSFPFFLTSSAGQRFAGFVWIPSEKILGWLPMGSWGDSGEDLITTPHSIRPGLPPYVVANSATRIGLGAITPHAIHSAGFWWGDNTASGVGPSFGPWRGLGASGASTPVKSIWE